jgi:hypothetical protein
MFYCSEESPESPPQNSTGRLVIKSNPSGARIYLLGTDTGMNTPDSIDNLEPGDYDGFLYMQYYDTTYFTATIFKNLTTTKEITLDDIFIEFEWDYILRYTGDSVKFSYQINQDILLDSIIIDRPIDASGMYTKEKYIYNKKLLVWEDQIGNRLTYFLPPEEDGRQYYPRFETFTYWINVYGQKAHGSQGYFHIFYLQEV